MTRLNPNYRFDSFIVGSSNEVAYTAAQAFADGTETSRLLLICGPRASGKTHLLRSVAHRFYERYPGKEMRCITAEQFVNAMRDAEHKGNLTGFRVGVSKISILLVDDIQFLQTRQWSQGEFLHVAKTMRESGKQVVLTSLFSPDELIFERAFIEYVQSGRTVELEPPGQEIKIDILIRDAEEAGFEMPDEIAEYLAAADNFSLSQIRGCLRTLIAFCSVKQTRPTVPLAGELLERQGTKLSFDGILSAVSKHFGSSIAELKTKSNTPQICEPRQIAMYLAAEAGIGISDIARRVGKNRSSVRYSVKKIGEALKTNPELEALLLRLSERIDN